MSEVLLCSKTILKNEVINFLKIANLVIKI